jgi:hypothetical protein
MDGLFVGGGVRVCQLQMFVECNCGGVLDILMGDWTVI